MTTEPLDQTISDKKPADKTETDKPESNPTKITEKNSETEVLEVLKENNDKNPKSQKIPKITNITVKNTNGDAKIIRQNNPEPLPKRKKALTPAEALKLLKTTKEASRKSKTILSKTKKDWNSFTKTNKISTDLKLATKSKNSFLGNSDFLARTQQKKDGLAREARIKGMGKI